MEKGEYQIRFTGKDTPEIVKFGQDKYIQIDKKVLAESNEALLAIKPLYMLSEMAVNRYHQQDPTLKVNPLEGVWSLIDKSLGYTNPKNIIGNFMIKQPNKLSEAVFESLKAELLQSSGNEDFSEYLKAAKYISIDEGSYIKMLHLGPYSKEQSSFNVMEKYAAELGLKRKYDSHRETYIRDIQTVTSDKFETILKFQVE